MIRGLATAFLGVGRCEAGEAVAAAEEDDAAADEDAAAEEDDDDAGVANALGDEALDAAAAVPVGGNFGENTFCRARPKEDLAAGDGAAAAVAAAVVVVVVVGELGADPTAAPGGADRCAPAST